MLDVLHYIGFDEQRAVLERCRAALRAAPSCSDSPLAWRRGRSQLVTSAPTPGTVRRVESGGRAACVANLDGSVYAIDDRCLHKQASLAEGRLEGDLIVCPSHWWKYSMVDGALQGGSASVASYPVEVIDGEVVVVLPAFEAGPELLDEVGQHLHVVLVDLRQLVDQVRIFAVMRATVERQRWRCAFRIDATGEVAREQQRADAGDIGLERQHLQVEQKFDIVLERARHAHGLIRNEDIAGGGLRFDDALLYVADGIKVFAEFRAVLRAELAAQIGDFLGEFVQQAPVFLGTGRALLRRATHAEHALKDEPRVGFRRQRSRGSTPGHAIHVGASIAVIARANHVDAVDGHFQRGKLGVGADLGRDHLVDGGAGLEIGALGRFRVNAAHETGGGTRMLPAHVPLVGSGEIVEPGEHRQAVAEGLNPLEGRRDFKIGAIGGRSPLAHVGAVTDVDRRKAGRALGVRIEGGHHRIQKRKGHGRAHSAEEGPPWQS